MSEVTEIAKKKNPLNSPEISLFSYQTLKYFSLLKTTFTRSEATVKCWGTGVIGIT